MNQEESEFPKMLTVKQLARYLEMDENTIYRLAESGKIPGMKVGSEWRFKKELVDEWLEEVSLLTFIQF